MSLKPRPRAGVVASVAAFSMLIASWAVPRAQQPAPPATPAAPQTPAAQPPAPAPAAPPAKPFVPLAASTMAASPETFVGEMVSLTGAVEQNVGSLAFSIDQDKTKPTGKEVLILAPRLNEPVTLNTYVTVLGEVVKFDPAEIAKKNKDFKLDLPPDAAAKYSGRPVVLATAIINAAGIDVARRLPPPLTAEEEVFMKVMQQVGPANAALRKALEGSDVKLAKENALVLTQAFTQTEAFWKKKSRPDAVQWAQDARKHADAIDKAAAAGKWDEVKTAAGTLGQQCAACHGAYRERFDDGSFRIKLPK